MSNTQPKTEHQSHEDVYTCYYSLQSALDCCKADSDAAPNNKGYCDYTPPTNRSEWSGNVTYREAIKLLERGDPSLKSKLLTIPEIPVINTKTIGYNNDVAGDSVDVGMFLQGEPDYFLNPVITNAETPIVNLLINITVSSFVGAKQLQRQGLAVASLIQTIERTGKTVNLDILCRLVSDKSPSRFCDTLVTVKSSTEYINDDRLYFVVMHVGFYRQLILRLIDFIPVSQYKECRVSVGRGRPGRLSEHNSYPGKYNLHIDWNNDNELNHDNKILPWIKTKLEKLNLLDGVN